MRTKNKMTLVFFSGCAKMNKELCVSDNLKGEVAKKYSAANLLKSFFDLQRFLSVLQIN